MNEKIIITYGIFYFVHLKAFNLVENVHRVPIDPLNLTIKSTVSLCYFLGFGI